MVLHPLVDVQIGGRRGIEAGEQLVHDDQELHLPGLVHEAPLDLLLELLGPVHGLVRGLVEVVREHLPVDVVLEEFLGEPLARLFALDVPCGRAVGGDDGAPVLQFGLPERLEEAAGRVDTVRYEHGVSAAALQAVPRLHVHQDVGHDLPDPGQRTRDLSHGAPPLPELCLGQITQSLGLRVEPLVDLGLRGDVLVDVARLVAQVQDHSVVNSLVVLVGVDVRAEDLDAALLVGSEERRSGEPDQGGRRGGWPSWPCAACRTGSGDTRPRRRRFRPAAASHLRCGSGGSLTY